MEIVILPFFHSSIKRRQCRCVLSSLSIDKVISVDLTDIKYHIVRLYMNLFSSDSAQIDEDLSTVDDIVPSLVSQEENSPLVTIPSADVIHDAVFAMDALLAPRHDGFSGCFFQHCWEIVGRNVILTVQNFFHFGVVASSLNSNFIVLLPKMRDSIMVDQFRPIVLETSDEKLHFVLVLGAGPGAWCWYKLRCLMETSGYKVTCLDLKGAGIDRTDPETISSFDEYNQPLIDFFLHLPENDKVFIFADACKGLASIS
ncbi:hypothetical protein Ddye_019832 [Dipteronia dyeriana]|uniref:Uncharacterized protein n=1 Tax=Dipteronia dyeriana TaxID=168575 RepID=A0AAD9TZ49_9ROSI|nr:hypothetical protein Ddye_019832 [Dipteronia dyeriana]